MNTRGHTQSPGKRTMNEHSRLSPQDVQTPLSGHRLALQNLCSCTTEASRRLSLHTKDSPGSSVQSIPGPNLSIRIPNLPLVTHGVPKPKARPLCLCGGELTHFRLSSPILLVLPVRVSLEWQTLSEDASPGPLRAQKEKEFARLNDNTDRGQFWADFPIAKI